MYCPTCGAEYAQSINYCKRCGSIMATPANNIEVHVPRPRFGWMFSAIAAMGIFGLIACFTAFESFAHSGLRGKELIFPFIFGLFFISFIAGGLLWQLSRLISTFRENIRHPKSEMPSQPIANPTRPMTALHEPLSSVGEHTTRSFDPKIYLEAEKRRKAE